MERAVYRGLLLFAGTALAIYAFGLILWPFLVPIAWALCITSLTLRPYRWLARRLRRPRLAAGTMVLLTAVGILGPILVVGGLFVEQARQLDFGPSIERLKEEFPGLLVWINSSLAYFGVDPLPNFLQDLGNDLPAIAAHVFSPGMWAGALGVLMAPFLFIFGLLVTLITQYFLYRESVQLRQTVCDISPLPTDDTNRVLRTLHAATTSAIAGGLLVAAVQGALGGVMFVIAGIQSPVLWGVIMAAFSLLPFGGTALVWTPAGVYLLLTGNPLAGWFVLIFGAVIVGSADNVLRPWLLARLGGVEARIHPMLLFFAILSGVQLFGISGIVFGPLLLALLTTMVQIYREHVRRTDTARPPATARP